MAADRLKAGSANADKKAECVGNGVETASNQNGVSYGNSDNNRARRRPGATRRKIHPKSPG